MIAFLDKKKYNTKRARDAVEMQPEPKAEPTLNGLSPSTAPTTVTAAISTTNQALGQTNHLSRPTPDIFAEVAQAPELLSYYWHTIDEDKFPDISLPCLYRQPNGVKVKYLSVRIIENIILSQFASMDSPEIKAYGALLSVKCRPAEVDLLNEINKNHACYGFNFSDKDSLVKLDDFLTFYDILVRTCPLKTPSVGDPQLVQDNLSRATKIVNILSSQDWYLNAVNRADQLIAVTSDSRLTCRNYLNAAISQAHQKIATDAARKKAASQASLHTPPPPQTPQTPQTPQIQHLAQLSPANKNILSIRTKFFKITGRYTKIGPFFKIKFE